MNRPPVPQILRGARWPLLETPLAVSIAAATMVQSQATIHPIISRSDQSLSHALLPLPKSTQDNAGIVSIYNRKGEGECSLHLTSDRAISYLGIYRDRLLFRDRPRSGDRLLSGSASASTGRQPFSCNASATFGLVISRFSHHHACARTCSPGDCSSSDSTDEVIERLLFRPVSSPGPSSSSKGCSSATSERQPCRLSSATNAGSVISRVPHHQACDGDCDCYCADSLLGGQGGSIRWL
jgi:hypothetical protein